MQKRNPPSGTRIAVYAIHAVLVLAPIVLFAAVLLTDVLYWRTADPQWTTMSSWLLLIGLAIAAGATMADLIRLLGDEGFRHLRPAWMHLLGIGLALLLSVMNFVFHVRDGYSAVVPAGPLLSAAVVFILLFTGWVGWGLVQRNRTGVAEAGAAGSKEA